MIGLCCQYLENKKNKYVNITNEKTLRYNEYLKNKYSNDKIIDTWKNNIDGMFNIIKKCNELNIKVFRISSNLFSLYDSCENLLENDELKLKLNGVGKYCIENNIRLTSHPDQFVVLSSNNKDVIDKSIKMLEHHAWIFDNMGLDKTPYYSINIHGGKRGNLKVLIDSINTLKENVRNRLTLENDELSYNVKDLYEVYKEVGVPICFDSHHHTFNTGDYVDEKAFDISLSTWKHKPMTHLSNTDPNNINGNFQDRRKHSDYVHYIPSYQLKYNNENKIDIDFEFKMKNIAIFKAVKDFGIVL